VAGGPAFFLHLHYDRKMKIALIRDKGLRFFPPSFATSRRGVGRDDAKGGRHAL
jgi:hypothetical protein